MEAQKFFENDIGVTLKNRKNLRDNANLLYWYKELYSEMFAGINNFADQRILEIGSGTSPLKHFYPNVLTSDIMPLDYLDYVFDAHNIHIEKKIEDDSLDILTFTNVLHHLRNPIEFLLRALTKLNANGQILFAEPYFSLTSRAIFVSLHSEPSLFNIEQPILEIVEGPLSSANQALPYLIFFKKPEWRRVIDGQYIFSLSEVKFFSSLSYMMTGGISKKIPIPQSLYQIFFKLDKIFSQKFPRLGASFFIVRLERRKTSFNIH